MAASINLKSLSGRTVLLVSIAVGSFLTVLLFWGSQTSGSSSDEWIHMSDLSGMRMASNPDTPQHFGVYGLSFQLLSHLAAVASGLEVVGEVSYTAQAFALRHLVVAILAFLTAVAVGFIVWLVSRQLIWGIWSAVALLAIPSFFGHGLFNTKDIPTATGYTLFTLAAVLSLYLTTKLKRNKLLPAVIISLSAIGIWISAGTRLGMVFPFLITLGLIIGFLLIAKAFVRSTLFLVWPAIKSLIAGAALGLAFVFVTNPCLVAPVSIKCTTGLELLPEVFGGSSKYGWVGTTFIAGTQVPSQDPSFWLLPVAVAAGMPVLIGALALVGSIFFWENYQLPAEPLVQQQVSPTDYRWLLSGMVGLVVLQVSLVPLAAIVLRSTIYDLQRQFLFVYPGLAALAGLGLALISQKSFGSARWPSASTFTVVALASAAITLPAFESFRLWPYSYVYVNPVATVGGFREYWESDYWSISYREAIQSVPIDQQVSIYGPYWVATPYLNLSRPRAKRVDLAREEKLVIQMHRAGYGWTGLPAECRLVRTIARTIRSHEVPLAYIGACPEGFEDESLFGPEEIEQGPWKS